MEMPERFADIVATAPVRHDAGDVIGYSREGRSVRGFRFGTGRVAVSLIAGCHADEPVGPRLLRHFVSYLTHREPGDAILSEFDWWIVPHINPDGESRNQTWQHPDAAAYDLIPYLQHVVRELPGDDMEFGFPRDDEDSGARPENRAVTAWWRSASHPFRFHCSLHGMAFAAGPWFLIDRAWQHRIASLERVCTDRVRRLGYTLHDVQRNGEKGFVRLGRGFCTRPDSHSMIAHFEQIGDVDTARKFRPSSMETIRRISGDVFTVVSEMPLFITPGVGDHLGPPDPVADLWRERVTRWKLQVAEGRTRQVIDEAQTAGLSPMRVRDQMDLQWTLISAGITTSIS